MMWLNISCGLAVLVTIIFFALTWDKEFYSSTTLPPAKKIK